VLKHHRFLHLGEAQEMPDFMGDLMRRGTMRCSKKFME